MLAAQFLISVHGGCFGSVVGFMRPPVLTLHGLRGIHAMNGLKILPATLMNGGAVVASAAAVRWPETLAMAVASAMGGYVVALGAALTAYVFRRGM